MNLQRNLIISFLIVAMGVACLIVFGQKPDAPAAERPSTERAAMVTTAEVNDWQQLINIETDGEAVTWRIVTVGAEVAGRIIRKTAGARGGTWVPAGELLFEIDPTNYELEAERLKAQLDQQDEQLRGVSVDLRNTAELISLAEEEAAIQQRHLKRIQDLRGRGTANERELDEAIRQELTARNALQMLKNQQNVLEQQQKTQQAGRALIEVQLNRARVDVDRCRVVSPLDGRMVDDVVEEGDYVKAGDDLVHISDGSRMEIKTKLLPDQLAWVWQQHAFLQKGETSSADPINLPPVPCEVGYDFEGVETIWDGYLARVEGTGVDRATRTFPCRVLVEKPQQTRFNDSAGGRAAVAPPTLLSGMFVRIRIPVESPLPLLRVPVEAVRPGDQVWVSDGGRLKIRNITQVHVSGHDSLIRRDGSGLKAGDRVITSPLPSVQEGMLVRDVEEGDVSKEQPQTNSEGAGSQPRKAPKEAAVPQEVP
ncbi:MAG: HlyD family efflux transporter periplasmic adaptor subunit [Planctomycetaceae bacterium]